MTKVSRDAASGAPRVLIENSEYWLSNVGDLAMLDVTIRRVRERWPGARIGVLTNTPHLLRAYFPGTDPITPKGRRAWVGPSAVGRLCEELGPRLVGPLAIAWVTTKAWLPQKAGSLRRKARKALALTLGATVRRSRSSSTSEKPRTRVGAEPVVPRNTASAASTASLVLALGGGYVTDADEAQARRVLTLLEHAHRLGLPTAMIGQGMGPVENPALMSRLCEALPDVAFFGLREGRRGPDLLFRAGVSADRIQVTGDDAIELSYSLRRDELGSDLGICLRVAGYSPLSREARGRFKSALHEVANELSAGLSPVIIAEYKSQDRRSTLPLTRGFEPVRKPHRRFARPQEVAAQVGQCRVLVTGAYHAAVFALAQGIPVVGLTTSLYYDDKFLGLADMFDGGLEMVRLDTGLFPERLTSAVRSAWEKAPEERVPLLASAERQIDASRRGLARVLDLVDAPPQGEPAARS